MKFLKTLLDKLLPPIEIVEPIVDDTHPKEHLSKTDREFIEYFESVISERPEAYLVPGEVLYTVTMSELLRYSKAVFVMGAESGVINSEVQVGDQSGKHQ